MSVDMLDKRDLHVQVKSYLADCIRKKSYSPGVSLPSNREFAKMLNVSALTVQRAILSLVADGLLYTRRGKGTFIRDNGEGVPARRKTGLYACVIPTIRCNTVATTVDALDSIIFGEGGNHMLLCNSQCDFEREVQMLDSLLDRAVDALIYQCNPNLYKWPIFVQAIDVRLQKFISAGVPVVLLDEFMRPGRYDTVLPDEEQICEQVVQHLVKLKHQRMVFIGYAMLFEEKVCAFRKAVKDAGLN